jgi:hypothetical protein
MNATLIIGTVKRDLAPGQVLTDWSFIVSSNGAQVARQDVAVPTASFDLPPGDYTATAQRFDSTGAAFGGVASASFTVVQPPEQGDAADTLTVTLA